MKGMLQSLEAVIGILLILTVATAIYSREVQLPDFESVNFKIRGFSALKTLDNTGELRKSISLNDTTYVENKLSDILPKNLNLKVVFCGFECSAPNIASDKLMSVSYLISGDVNQINPKQVLLYMWLP